MMMVALGLVFPPVGMIAFAVSATGNVALTKVYAGTSVLMLAIVITTALIMIFPEIVLWLPRTMNSAPVIGVRPVTDCRGTRRP